MKYHEFIASLISICERNRDAYSLRGARAQIKITKGATGTAYDVIDLT